MASNLILVRDLITPDLQKKIAAAARQGAPVLRAGADYLIEIARSAFRDPSRRVATPNRDFQSAGVPKPPFGSKLTQKKAHDSECGPILGRDVGRQGRVNTEIAL